MSVIKTVAAGLLAWAAFGTLAHAAPMSWYGSQENWPVWYANQASSNGDLYSSVNSSTPVYVPPSISQWWNSGSSIPDAPAAVASAPAVSAPTPAASSPGGPPVLAYINLGSGPYPNAADLTTGTSQAWYNSPSVTQAFGGSPTAAQQSNFTQTVLADIQHTFQISGMNVTLTGDPNVPALHTMSVVSGASYPSNPNAIGITQVGTNGFGFIDKLSYATSPDQLAWAVAHNISHELMHAIGVATHPDQTGTYLDSATATWQMLIDPNTKLSPQAVQLMLAAMGGASGLNSSLGAELLKAANHPPNCNCQFCRMTRGLGIDGAQILAQPVPEPSTLAIWSMALVGSVTVLRRNSIRRAA